ncbi:hypothetical protein ACIBJI_30245 [Nocardia sp. NPDC050408]
MQVDYHGLSRAIYAADIAPPLDGRRSAVVADDPAAGYGLA